MALVVEDCPANAMVLSSILSKIDIDSDVVVNGQEALQVPLDKKLWCLWVFKCQWWIVWRPLRSLKKRSYPAPIAVTWEADASVRGECLELGMADMLLKSIRLADVKNTLLRLYWVYYSA